MAKPDQSYGKEKYKINRGAVAALTHLQPQQFSLPNPRLLIYVKIRNQYRRKHIKSAQDNSQKKIYSEDVQASPGGRT